ncbi:hypothetical protein E4U21_005344 [Claviceps maximensis]|nr:hypothetical protein E4U21_005344 [Claviceps maximensis]
MEEIRRRIEEEQLLRQNAETRLQELQLLRQNAETRLQELQLRRQNAETRAQNAERFVIKQTIQQYLEACHKLDVDIDVVTYCSLTTGGPAADRTGRIFPRRIIVWEDFERQQGTIWADLLAIDPFVSKKIFPPQINIEYVRTVTKPISSEIGLQNYERDVVENAVEIIINILSENSLLQECLNILGPVSFESHTNLGLSDGAVQSCIYRKAGSQATPVLAIEYKAPQKVSVNDIVTGLKSGNIEPARDVIDKDGDGYGFFSKRLATAVITQLFSYMIGKGIRYGYVCTGQVFVFLHIADDPSTVYYSICVPKQDVMDNDDARLHRTAVAQVVAFFIQALRSNPMPETWYDQAKELKLWKIEYEEFFLSTQKERKDNKVLVSEYKPRQWRKLTSPIPLSHRSSCRPLSNNDRAPDNDDDPPSPSPQPQRKRKFDGATSKTVGAPVKGGEQQEHGSTTKQNIRSRPFCTHSCLRGLAHGGPMDTSCPNREYHGQRHIPRHEFLSCLRSQLARDRGPDADCVCLNRAGARGALFKVRLSSHGYTLVAKGVESFDQDVLQYEEEMYDRLVDIQGQYIPVCLGNIDLVLPCHYDGGVYTHFMLLGWAGWPLFDCIDQLDDAKVTHGVTRIFEALHNLRVLHRDAEPRNILCDESGNLMAVDLERAEYCGRQPLDQVDLDVKRKRLVYKPGEKEFAKELAHAVAACRRCIRRRS